MWHNIRTRPQADYKIFRLSDDDELTDDKLLEFISRHKNRVDMRYRKLWNAYRGDYDIYNTAIVPEKESYKPDNRIAVNYAETGASAFIGFQFGNPLKIRYDRPAAPDADAEKAAIRARAVAAEIARVRARNNLASLDAKTGTAAFVFGSGQRILYIEDGQVRVTGVSRMEGFPIYSDSIDPRLRYFVRLYRDDDGTERGSISDDTDVRYFVLDGPTGITWKEEHPHGFPGVPAVIYNMRSVEDGYEPLGGFENALPAVNAFAFVLSAKWNDVEAFVEAIMLIAGPEVTDQIAKMIQSTRLVNIPCSDAKDIIVKYLERPSSDETQEHLLTWLREIIFQQMMVVDMNDDQFATTSGIALKYKMLPMQNLAADNWMCFEDADREMWRLICGNPLTPFRDDDWEYMDYTHTLNFPADIGDEADIAKKLDGIVSKRTQLSVLSIVQDVDKELDQIAKEREEEARIAATYGSAAAASTDTTGSGTPPPVTPADPSSAFRAALEPFMPSDGDDIDAARHARMSIGVILKMYDGLLLDYHRLHHRDDGTPTA